MVENHSTKVDPSSINSQNQLVLDDPAANDDEAETYADPIAHQPSSFRRQHPISNQTPRALPAVGSFTVQCANCFKWRLIPTKEKYEEIREQIIEQPFSCETAREWRSEISCDDPPDINQDGSRPWIIDKPNIAQPPSGWQRISRIRGEGTSMYTDVYYVAPSGKKLRSMVAIQRYLNEHPHYIEEGVSLSQFSFQIPRPSEENYVRKRPAPSAPLNDADDSGIPVSLTLHKMTSSSDQGKGKEKKKGKKQVLYPEGVPQGAFSSLPDFGSMGSFPASMSSLPPGSFVQYPTGAFLSGTITSRMMESFPAPMPPFPTGSYPQHHTGLDQSGSFTSQLMGAGTQLGGMPMQTSSWPQFGSSAPLFSASGAEFAMSTAQMLGHFTGGTADGMMRQSLSAFGSGTGTDVAMTTPQVIMTGSTDVPSPGGTRDLGTQAPGSRAQPSMDLDEEAGDSSDSNDDGGVTGVAVRGQSKAREPPADPADREVLHMFFDGTIENNVAVLTIATNLRNMMQQPYFTYGAWPEEEKKICWNRFNCTFQWDPAIEMLVYHWYNKVATARFAGSVNHAKKWWLKCQEDPIYRETHKCWIHRRFLPAFIDHWNLETTKNRSEQNKKNRDGGKKVNYMGGSVSTNKYRQKMADQLGVAPLDVPFQKVFLRTRAKEHDDGTIEWKNPQDQEAHDAYLAYCHKEFGQDTRLWPPWDIKQWVAIVGQSKKNRVPGLSTYAEPECVGYQGRKHPKFIETASSSFDPYRMEYQANLAATTANLAAANAKFATTNAKYEAQVKENETMKRQLAMLLEKLQMPVPEEFQIQQQQQQQHINMPETFYSATQSTYTNLDIGPVSGDPYYTGEPKSTHQEDNQTGGRSVGGGANDTTNFPNMGFDPNA